KKPGGLSGITSTTPNITVTATPNADGFTSATLTLSGAVTAGELWSVTLDGTPSSYTATAGDNLSSVADQLQLAIIRGGFGGQVNVGSANGPHTDYHGLAFDANGDLIAGNDGGVWRLASDLAAPDLTWDDLNTNLDITQFYSIAVDPTNTAYGGSQDNGTEKF